MIYLEKDLPIEKLNMLAMREGNSKRPIYRMHKWWARRLGCVFRMLILGAFSSETETAEAMWHKFYGGTNFENKIVLDPFMGGGTIVVEALRLGCKVIGVDINPVAWFITKKEVEPVSLEALDAAFARLEARAGQRIKRYYRTTCLHGHEAEVMYVFWIKKLACEACGRIVKLFPNYWIARRKEEKTMVCPNCHYIFTLRGRFEQAACPQCAQGFDPAKGVSGRGKYRCSCGHVGVHLDVIKKLQSPLALEMFGLEYYCPTCGRGYKRVDEHDRQLMAQAQAEFEQRRDQLLFPRQAIPVEGRSDPRPVNHGYTHFWQMFNPRQLLCLSILLEEIQRVEDTNIRELLLLAFSDCLDSNNIFCKYETDYFKISLLFGLHAYHPIERPAENNVWGTRYGRGTFVRCYQKMRRGKEYARRPYEQVFTNHRSTKHVIKGEQIAGRLADSWPALGRDSRNTLLLAGNSERLDFLPDGCVDAVITDPPYFDNVMYSELADFFYVWLRPGLKDTYPWFEPELSHRRRELVQNEKQGKTAGFFSDGLVSVFEECWRVLKDDGIMLFTFHHKEPSAWSALAQILLEAGFYVSAAPIVRSEGKSGFHSSSGNVKYDACLVCRKREAEVQPRDWESVKEDIKNHAARWAARLIKSGMVVNRVDLQAIVMAKFLEFYGRSWPEIRRDGTSVVMEEAVQEMQVLVHGLSDLQSELESWDRAGQAAQLRLLEERAMYCV